MPPAALPDAYDLSVPRVAELLHVDEKTIRRWADNGKLPCWRTPGGHRRFRRSDVDALLPAERAAS